MSSKKHLLSDIPSVTECINTLVALPSLHEIPLWRIKRLVRLFLDEKRKLILKDLFVGSISLNENGILPELIEYICNEHSPNFTPVVNATGVIIHTNLGRSLLPANTLNDLVTGGSKYSNLEFDLVAGHRGSRYRLVEDIICELTGAESALVVNNNAAAVLIVLDTLAKNKEVIVSRGQLVEIGGSFRIPDVMTRSGAKLKEVGATNRTHLLDYETAITDDTAMLLKVHCSNYKIIGFTSEVNNKDLSKLGKKHNIPVVEDLGSGCLVDLTQFGLQKEPTVQEVIASGVDVVTFSGDKLLGGPQAGIIIGKKEIIDRIKNNPLNRALRIDKFTLIGLESIFRYYLDVDRAFENIPTLQMISASLDSVKKKAETCLTMLDDKVSMIGKVTIVETASKVGGGALPEQNLPSFALSFAPYEIKINTIEQRLRALTVPIIGRVEDGKLILDMRTVADDEIIQLATGLCSVLVETLKV